MSDESYSFSTARARLEDIVAQVRKKDTSLEKSLDLLEEGVKLANSCTELIDQQDWTSVNAAADDAAEGTGAEPAETGATAIEAVTVVEDVVIENEDGEVIAELVEVTEYDFEAADVETAPAAASGDAADDFAEVDDLWADESETDPAEEPDEPSADEG